MPFCKACLGFRQMSCSDGGALRSLSQEAISVSGIWKQRDRCRHSCDPRPASMNCLEITKAYPIVMHGLVARASPASQDCPKAGVVGDCWGFNG